MFSKTIMIVWTLFILWMFFTGVNNIQMQPISHEVQIGAIIVAMIGYFLIWCVVALPTYIISRMFRKKG